MDMFEVYTRGAIRDDMQNICFVSYVEIGHTPLRQTSQVHKQGLGRHLYYKHAKALTINNNDCRKGVHTGSMAVCGSRLYNNDLIPYSNKMYFFKSVEESAGRYFR